MKNPISLDEVLFDVGQVPIEAVIGSNGSTRRIQVPGKKALINERTGHVLGVVGRDYKVVTNTEAIDLARSVCEQAFTGLSMVEWEAKRVAAPRTLSYAHIDLVHRTHVLNYWDVGGGKNDPFTPFLRVTNSFNGARALRFDIGFMRSHCSNGVIFEEEVATIRAAHSREALKQLQVEIQSRSLPQMWDEFSKFLTSIRAIEMDLDLSLEALQSVLRLPLPSPKDRPRRQQQFHELQTDIRGRLTGYRQELGPNAYAVFNTMTDLAARPPECPLFQKDRDTLEKRAGRWLRRLGLDARRPGFDVANWVDVVAREGRVPGSVEMGESVSEEAGPVRPNLRNL